MKTRFISALACGIMMLSSAAHAAWPERPITLIVPFPAGSGTDVPARIVAQSLSKSLGQPVVIENRTGASGIIGSNLVATAKPGGYTFGLITASTHALAPHLDPKPPYDSIKDFSFVGMVGNTPYVLITSPQLGAKDVSGLIEMAKKKPGELTYGSAGPASLAHLIGKRFGTETGIDIRHIAYKASAQSMTDIMTGRLDMQFATLAPVLSAIKAGQVKALAVTGDVRADSLPDVPTMIEAGVPKFDPVLWMAIAAPKGESPEIIEKMNDALNKALNGDAKKALLDQGLHIEPGSPGAVSARVEADSAVWGKVTAEN